MNEGRRGTRIAAILAALWLGGCAQIRTKSTIEIIANPDAQAQVFGPPAGATIARGATAHWSQDGNTIEFEVLETRRCAVVRHDPVVQVETIQRSTGGALYWEFGIGGALLVGGLVGLIAPQLFGQRTINAEGQTSRDKAAGYRIGGILTGLSVVPIGAGIYDAVRSRDEVRHTDAFVPHIGSEAPCDEPERPLQARTVEIIVGDWKTTEPTDDKGRVRFLLPKVSELPGPNKEVLAPALSETVLATLAEGGFFDVTRFADTIVPSRGRMEVVVGDDGRFVRYIQSRTVVGVLRLGGRAALAFDFVAPYTTPSAAEHSGTVQIDPQPVRRAPPKPKVAPNKADHARDASP